MVRPCPYAHPWLRIFHLCLATAKSKWVLLYSWVFLCPRTRFFPNISEILLSAFSKREQNESDCLLASLGLFHQFYQPPTINRLVGVLTAIFSC